MAKSSPGCTGPGASAWVMHVGPRETVHGEAIFWPTRRGEPNFRSIRVWTTFPFGLVKKSITIDQPQHTRIFPRLHQLRRGLLRSIDTPGPVGTRITQRPGGTDDYFGLREYRDNESVRHIAWKRSASLGGWGGEQLVCIERSIPSPPRLRVVLDLSTPTDSLRVEANDKWSPRELEERAISLTASIIAQANIEGFEIGLTVVGVGQRAEVRGQNSDLGGDALTSNIGSLTPAPRPVPGPVLPGQGWGGAFDLHFAVRRNYWHARKLLAALASIDLDRPRAEPEFSIINDNERAGLLVIRPDRQQPFAERADIVFFTGRQLERLTTGPIGWEPPASISTAHQQEITADERG